MTGQNGFTSSPLSARFRRVGQLAAMTGAGGIVACVVLWIIAVAIQHRSPETCSGFYKGFLSAWFFFLSISLGAMMAVMIHHLVGGEWGYFVQRFGEAAANVLPLLFVLFLPILLGLHQLYPWADADNQNAFVVHKRVYLNSGFFILRYIIYFAAWILTAALLRKLSLARDRNSSPQTEHSLRVVSAVGLLVYFITMSLASVDWIMSLEPEWYSTIFGLLTCLIQAIIGMAMLIIMLELLAGGPPFSASVQPRHFNDLATLLITCIILWAYHAFAQLLVTWMGNTQAEIPWYVKRNRGVWHAMFISLMVAGFLVPFVLLLQRGIKKRGRAMLWISCFVLLMQMVNVYWTIAPSGDDLFPAFEWFNAMVTVISLIGIGGLWIAMFLWLLDGPPLMPMGDGVPVGLTSPSGAVVEGAPEHGI